MNARPGNPLIANPPPGNGGIAVPPTSSEWGAPVFVVGVWGILLIGALWFSHRYSSNVPFADEWWYISFATGDEPISLSWLWESHSSHRIPIPKLLWVGLFRFTSLAFQIGAYVNVVLVAILALLNVWIAKSVRGRLSYTDAFFPIALLHWGHSVNFTLWWQITEIVAPILTCTILGIVALHGNNMTPRLEALTVAFIFLLPLCGPSGLPLVGTMSVWFAYLSMLRWKNDRRRSLALAGVSLIGVVLILLYFHGIEKSVIGEGYAALPDIRSILRTSLQFLSVSLGTGTESFWRIGGALVFGMIVVTSCFLFVKWISDPIKQPRALGLLLFLVAMIGLALGIGVSRSHLSLWAGFTRYYLILGVPALFGLYFAWESYSGSAFGRLVQVCLFTIVCALLSLNGWDGTQGGAHLKAIRMAVADDIAAGIPIQIIADRNARNVTGAHSEQDRMARALQQLHDAGSPPFNGIRTRDLEEVSLRLDPIAVSNAKWDNGRLETYGAQGEIVFALPHPEKVIAVRVHYAIRHSNRIANCELCWNPAMGMGFSAERCFTWEQDTIIGNAARTIWINDTLAEFRLRPDTNRCALDLQEIVLLKAGPSEKDL